MKKMTQTAAVCLAASLISVPYVYAQYLSKFHDFSLGTNLAGITKQLRNSY